jgi:predicted short-subunit dehydrogenase-like oxidoreductase (DUF2520 family)
MAQTVAIVGGGRTGRALALLCARSGARIGAVVCRTEARAREAVRAIGAGTPATRVEAAAGADAVFVAVPDDALPEVARACAKAARRGAFLAHACGAVGHEVFPSGRRAAIHPLRSFADPTAAADAFAGTYCFWDADPDAAAEAREWIAAWGGRAVEVAPGGKALYHAAAVFASNYVVVLLDIAEQLLARAGVDAAAGREAMLALAGGVLANVSRVGTRPALTGPVERGDVGTIAAHRRALAQMPEADEAYRVLGRRAAAIARQTRGWDDAMARRVGEVLAP